MENNSGSVKPGADKSAGALKPGSVSRGASFSNLSTATKKAILSGAICVLLFVLFSVLQPNKFPTLGNLINLAQQIVTFSIVGCGLTFCLVCGGTDLSAGSVMALSGFIIVALLGAGVPVWLSVVACLGVGLLTGVFNGFSIEILGIVPFVATLGTQWLYRGIANVLTNGSPLYTAEVVASQQVRNQFYVLGGGKISDAVPLPWSVVIMVVYGAILATVLAKTKVGRQVYACGSNLEAAKLSGINAVGTRMFAYCVSGLSAAVAGILVTSRLSSAQPGTGVGIELYAIAAAVLGGVSINGGEGNVVNAFIGALVMGILCNGLNLNGVNSYWQQAILGLVLVVACAANMLRRRKTS